MTARIGWILHSDLQEEKGFLGFVQGLTVAKKSSTENVDLTAKMLGKGFFNKATSGEGWVNEYTNVSPNDVGTVWMCPFLSPEMQQVKQLEEIIMKSEARRKSRKSGKRKSRSRSEDAAWPVEREVRSLH